MTKFQQFSIIIAWFGLAISAFLFVGRSLWYRYGEKSPKLDVKKQLLASVRRRSMYFRFVSWPFAFAVVTSSWLWSGAHMWATLTYVIYAYTIVATFGLLLRIKRLLIWWLQGRKLYKQHGVGVPDFGIMWATIWCILGWTYVHVNW